MRFRSRIQKRNLIIEKVLSHEITFYKIQNFLEKFKKLFANKWAKNPKGKKNEFCLSVINEFKECIQVSSRFNFYCNVEAIREQLP